MRIFQLELKLTDALDVLNDIIFLMLCFKVNKMLKQHNKFQQSLLKSNLSVVGLKYLNYSRAEQNKFNVQILQ